MAIIEIENNAYTIKLHKLNQCFFFWQTSISLLANSIDLVIRSRHDGRCLCWGTAPHFFLAHLLCFAVQRLHSLCLLASKNHCEAAPHAQVSPIAHRHASHPGCAVQVMTAGKENRTAAPPRRYRRSGRTKGGSQGRPAVD